jgi:type II secretory pathway predicted ATPase ExeA
MSDAPNGAVIPDQPLSVTLSIAQWRAVLETLARPLVPIQQLIGDIDRQCQAQIQRLQQPPMAMNMPPRGNGADVEERAHE